MLRTCNYISSFFVVLEVGKISDNMTGEKSAS